VKYEDKEAVRKQLSDLKENWPELKAKLQNQVYSFEKMQNLFKIAGAPCDPSDIGVSREQIKAMFPKVQLMRSRYNILDLALRGGFYDEIVESVFNKGGAWETK
jgi:glycerol-1-phosphate dehydrogenase [NAD(P)+]